jgi:molybdopterin synthase catalytic subunit
MDISRAIAELKKDPLFRENVGMVLIHNGVVRAWSRKGHQRVTSVHVTPDLHKIEEIRREFEKRPGIFKVVIEANSGELRPGDDLLFLIVAGDIRENVKPALSDLLDRVKVEAIHKKEIVS